MIRKAQRAAAEALRDLCGDGPRPDHRDRRRGRGGSIDSPPPFGPAAIVWRRVSTWRSVETVATVIKSPYLWLRSATTSLLFERRYRVRTEDRIELDELGLASPGRQGYQPAGWMCLRRILSTREVTERDVFVDFGSGMGRIVLQAARYPFRKVIGVELSEKLHDIARENIDRNRQQLRCQHVELVHADVLDYKIPRDVTVVFLYNPFQGELFATFIERLIQSVEDNPRPLRIIYLNPVEERILLDIRRVRGVRTARGWRPGREWSRSNSIRMYDVLPRSTQPQVTREQKSNSSLPDVHEGQSFPMAQ